MQRDDARPVRPGGQQCLEPDLRRGAGVGEDQAGLALLDGADDLGKESKADLSGPGEALHGVRNQRVHLQRLGDQSLEDPPGSSRAVGVDAEQSVAGGFEIAQRSGESQRPQSAAGTGAAGRGRARSVRRASRPSARATRPPPPARGARTAPAASSRVSRSDRLSGVVTSALGSRSRCRARIRAGVSPVRDSTLQGMPRSSTGARSAASVSAGERAERRDPQHRERCGRPARRGGIVAQPFEQRSHPGGVGLPGTGRRVDQPALARRDRPPRPRSWNGNGSHCGARTTRARNRSARGRCSPPRAPAAVAPWAPPPPPPPRPLPLARLSAAQLGHAEDPRPALSPRDARYSQSMK